MRQILSFLLFVTTLISYGQSESGTSKKPTFDDYLKVISDKCYGKVFPDFEIKKSNQSIFSIKDFENKIVFVNFWFGGCSPCRAEIAGFNKMYDLLKDKPDFLFISFSFDPDEKINELVKKYNIHYKVLHLDKDECFRLNFNSGYPTNIILDKNRTVKFYITGGSLDVKEATDFVMTKIYPKILELF
jgi:cytochrome oxidase Cu insertion factor (SCO1/SenC/PrrC family)